jgi:hypothetical protein
MTTCRFPELLGSHLKRKPEKCQLFWKEVLSHILYHWENDHELREAEGCMERPSPRDKHDRSLLSLFIYYQKFIVGFTDLAKPLNYLAEVTLDSQWSSQAETASYEWHPS